MVIVALPKSFQSLFRWLYCSLLVDFSVASEQKDNYSVNSCEIDSQAYAACKSHFNILSSRSGSPEVSDHRHAAAAPGSQDRALKGHIVAVARNS